MSKLLSLFSRGGGGNSSTEAIRQSTTMTMAYLLEQNRKFEFFMRQKVERLEQLVSSQQQTRAEFEDEEFEEDLAEPETGEDQSNNGTAESQSASKPALAILAEDEPLTADTRPSPQAVTPPAPESAPSSASTEEGNSEDDMSRFFGGSSKQTAGPAAEEADSEPRSWESYLGVSDEEPTPTQENLADEQAATHDDEEAETGEHTEALTELSAQPDLQWIVNGSVRSPLVSEEEVAEAYSTDMVDDTEEAVELGQVTIEDGEVVVEEELDEADDAVNTGDDSQEPLREGEGKPGRMEEAVAGSGLQAEQPPQAESDEVEQGREGLKEEKDNHRTTPTPVVNKPAPVVKGRETAPPPVRITTQILNEGGEEEEEEVETLLPSWLINKLEKK